MAIGLVKTDMASEQPDDVKRPRARIKPDTELHEAWQDWVERFDTKADAVTTGLEHGLTGADLDKLEQGQENGGLAWYQVGVVALLAAAIGSTVAQAMLVFDVVVASGLTALALLVVGGVMYAYGD